MKFSDSIRAAVKVVPQQLDRALDEFGKAGEDAVRLLLDWRKWISFTIAPPLPDLIPLSIEWIGDAVQIFGNALQRIPALIAAELILGNLRMDKWYRQRVMTLDEAILLVYRVGVDSGIQNYQDAVPQEWLWANTINRYGKIANFLNKPGLGTLWKIFKVGPWKLIVTAVLYLIAFVKQLGVLIMLWNFSKVVENKERREQYFTKALRQDHPRKRERTTIRRRVGGVPP